MLLMIIAGGVVGSVIAYLAKGKKITDFYIRVIGGVSFIVISFYLLFPLMQRYSELINQLSLSLALISGLGVVFLSLQDLSKTKTQSL